MTINTWTMGFILMIIWKDCGVTKLSEVSWAHLKASTRHHKKKIGVISSGRDTSSKPKVSKITLNMSRQGGRKPNINSRTKNDDNESSSQRLDCKKSVQNSDQALECDLCCRGLHTKCQDMSPATYEFLRENTDLSIKCYCKHCKVTAMGIVSEV